MQLRRNSAGEITDGNTPIILVGGHYFLFKHDGLSPYGINIGDQPPLIISFQRNATGPVEPCSNGTRAGKIQFWTSTFGEDPCYLSRMRTQKNNLVRVFLTNSFNNTDWFPYKVTNDGKFKVEDAIENGNWNEEYFDRLRTFVAQASVCGIAVQLSVFNFFDFDDRAWPTEGKPGFSPWNPANAVDGTPNWNRDHLVHGTKRGARCEYFMDTSHTGVSRVRKKFINKLVLELKGFGNVIFELMNEPRGEAGYRLRDKLPFLREVTATILAACGTSWRPLLSVNASPASSLNKTELETPLDITAWKADADRTSDPNYDAIDIISYHGLSGLSFEERTCPYGPQSPASFAGVDRQSIADRRGRHLRDFPKKAMIFSTDGAHQYPFEFIDGSDMRVRDGQVETSLIRDTDLDRLIQRHCSDLGDWAYWCLKEAVTYRGRCHFQNHSSFYRSILYIKESYDKVTGGGGTTGNDFVPPFAAPAWTTWRSPNPPTNDFFTAVRLDAALGGIVLQMGTVANPVDVSQAGAIEVGFLRVFTATSASVQVRANYSPTSVSIRSQGALVAPAVALRLHAIDANGSVGGLIARAPVVLAPHAPAGELQFTLAVTPGQRYGVILAANVGIQYQNRAQGYGEVIVSYPRVSLRM